MHNFKLNINTEPLNTYLNLLHEASQNWKEEKEHTLEIIFHQDGTT